MFLLMYNSFGTALSTRLLNNFPFARLGVLMWPGIEDSDILDC